MKTNTVVYLERFWGASKMEGDWDVKGVKLCPFYLGYQEQHAACTASSLTVSVITSTYILGSRWL